MQTFGREFHGVMYKFMYVLIPRATHDGTNKLRNWDLWGPFAMTLIFGLLINSNLWDYHLLDSDQFILLFFSVFGGAVIITFNTRVLGGHISFLQSVSVLGYCLFPLFVAVMVLQVMRLVQFNVPLVRPLLIIGAFLWSVLCNFISYCSGKSLHFSQHSLR